MEESIVIVEGPNGHTPRSLTLAEATVSILFYSSIVNDIARNAATIGMEMEKERTILPETSRPTIMILGKSDSRRMPNKRMPKSPKLKRKKQEIPTKSPPNESEKNVILQGHAPPNVVEIPNMATIDSMKPLSTPKLESKCNCTDVGAFDM